MGSDSVLVTAVGGIVGYGIVRCLRKTGRALRIIGTDIYPDAIGQRWCDTFVQVPPARDPDYPDFLLGLLQEFAVDLALPGTEPEIEGWHGARERFASSSPAMMMLNRPEVINAMHDKWLAHQFFMRAGIPAPPSRIDDHYAAAVSELGSPMLLKRRHSNSGRGMRVLRNEEDFRKARREAGDEFMAQKIIGRDDAEFTASVFGFGDGAGLHGPQLQRILAPAGYTLKARTVEDAALTRRITELTEALKPLGPTNYQFRRHEGDYQVLEVNPRISSATSIREAFGFNEAGLCLDWFLDGVRPAAPSLRSGSAARFLTAQGFVDDEISD